MSNSVQIVLLSIAIVLAVLCASVSIWFTEMNEKSQERKVLAELSIILREVTVQLNKSDNAIDPENLRQEINKMNLKSIADVRFNKNGTMIALTKSSRQANRIIAAPIQSGDATDWYLAIGNFQLSDSTGISTSPDIRIHTLER